MDDQRTIGPEQPYAAQPYGYPPQQQDAPPSPGPWASAAPPYGPPALPLPGAAPGSGMGVAGFVTGLLGFLLCWVPGLGVVCAVLGIVFGSIGMGRLRRVGAPAGLAVAGLVLGILGLVLFVLFLVAWTSSPYSY